MKKLLKNASKYLEHFKLTLLLLLCTFNFSFAQQYEKLDVITAITTDSIKNITCLATFDNILWVGTDKDLYRVSSDSSKIGYKIDTILKKPIMICALLVKNKSELWASDNIGNLYHINQEADSMPTSYKKIETKIIGNVPIRKISWLNSTQNKIYLTCPSNYEPNEHKTFIFDIATQNIQRDISTKSINAQKNTKVFLQDFLISSDGDKWLATNTGTTILYKSNKKDNFITNYNTYKIVTNQSGDKVCCFSIQNNKTVLFIYSRDGNKINSVTLPDKNNYYRTNTSFIDYNGAIWIASNSANIQYLNINKPNIEFKELTNAAKISKYTKSDNIASIIDMVQSKDSSIWIATSAGLFKFGIPTPKSRIDTTVVKKQIISEHIIIKNLNFEVGDSIITTNSYEELSKIAKKMQKDTSITIKIKGHTDAPILINSTDTLKAMDEMIQLSEARARAVLHFLEKKGINSRRMTAIGLGYTQPLYTTKNSDESHSQNRRVEIEFIKP